MTLRISTDIGGTFTDVVVVDSARGTSIFKAASTPEDPIEGLIAGLRMAAAARGETLESLLGSCGFFSHGTTVGTDALLLGCTPPIGLLCTAGHRDVLLWREGGKDEPFEWKVDYPEPFVPRSLTQGIAERMSAEGDAVIPLDEHQAREAILRLRDTGVRSVAVAFLFSFVNPAHELRVEELLTELWPEALVSLSHRVNPVIREYRRTIDTCLDAALKPLIGEYIERLSRRLYDEGLRGEPHLLTSSGGLTSATEMASRPATSVYSGPSLSHVAGRHYARTAVGSDDLITCDMGGSSCDVTLVTAGRAPVTRDWRLGSETPGLPRADVHSFPAGGSSIAWVDEGGLIRIGPESAGSRPGPACYGRGGDQATVTDACVVLGYYDPEVFEPDGIRLRPEKAWEAIDGRVATPLGLEVLPAAFTVWNTACVTVTESIRELTSLKNIDPRGRVLVAGGGAAGACIIPVAAALGVRALVVPRTASVMSAVGGAIADVVRDFNRAHLMSTADFDFVDAQRLLDELADEAHSFLEGLGIPREARVLDYSVEARYPLQERELNVVLRDARLASDEDLSRLVSDFHAIHEQVRGVNEPDEDLELVLWTVRATGLLAEADSALRMAAAVETDAGDAEETPSPASRRQAFFAESGGMVETPLFDGDLVTTGQTVDGPCIIEEPTTCLVVPPGVSVRRASEDCHVIEFDDGASGREPGPQMDDTWADGEDQRGVRI